MLEEFLDILGYNALTAGGKKEAIEIVRKYKDRVSVVICDITLGNVSGFKVVENILEITQKCSLIFTSGYGIDEVERPNIPNKAYQFLPKPFSFEKLKHLLNAV